MDVILSARLNFKSEEQGTRADSEGRPLSKQKATSCRYTLRFTA
jgi:hypothetical protein